MTLPNFMIIGAARSGTTSLYEWLRQHPDVYMSPIKEPRYFAYEPALSKQYDFPVRTAQEYEKLFDGLARQSAIGEASPIYLPSPVAPDRIFRAVPDARLIVSLRNPADRAYSAYLLKRTSGEKRPFPEALQSRESYFEHSLYAANLRRYFDRFPRDHVKVVLFDDLIAGPDEVMRELFTFLGVDPEVRVQTAMTHNPSEHQSSRAVRRVMSRVIAAAYPLVPGRFRGRGIAGRVQRPLIRKADPLDADFRRTLLDRFRDDIDTTGKLIGRDLSHWLTS